MLASALIPSRGRFSQLKESIESLYQHANDPKDLEIIIRFDWNDADSLEKLQDIADDSVRVIIGPRLHGYGSLHLFYNELCALATGHWCFLWNDDVFMETQDWDLELAKYNDREKCIYVCHDRRNQGKAPSFPIFTRSIYTEYGQVSAHCFCDTYLAQFAGIHGIACPGGNIVVNHRLNKGDITHKEAELAAHSARAHC